MEPRVHLDNAIRIIFAILQDGAPSLTYMSAAVLLGLNVPFLTLTDELTLLDNLISEKLPKVATLELRLKSEYRLRGTNVQEVVEMLGARQQHLHDKLPQMTKNDVLKVRLSV